jgi:hypothetical protein
MVMTPVTLEDYEQAERDLAHEEARTGITVHALVTLLVSAILVVVNLTVAREFPWSAFAVGGMLVGLVAHWRFGFQKLDEQLLRQQHRIESRAAVVR